MEKIQHVVMAKRLEIRRQFALATSSCSVLSSFKCAIAWWFGHSGTRFSRSSGPPCDLGTMWCTSTTWEKPQITHALPYTRFASVRQWLACLSLPLSFCRWPSRPHSGEQYWSGRRLRALGTTFSDVPQTAQATVIRLYDLLLAPVRSRLSASRHWLEQYVLPFIAALVPEKISPQNWHALSTRGLNRTLLLCPETNRRPLPASTPHPHSQNPITTRPEWPFALSF